MNIIRKRFTGFMLPLLLAPTSVSASVPVEPIPSVYKVVQTEKLELLKANNDKLVLKLAELETKLQLLKMPSTELVKQLAVARNELQLCKQELKSAKNSLASAKALQEETLNSLMTLEKQIAAERKQQVSREKRLRRQHDTWLFIAGVALAYGITK